MCITNRIPQCMKNALTAHTRPRRLFNSARGAKNSRANDPAASTAKSASESYSAQGEQVVGMENHGPRMAETEQQEQQRGEEGRAEPVPQSERETQSADDHAAVYPVEQFQAGRSAEHNANRREQFRVRPHDLDEIVLPRSRIPEREQPDQDAQHRQPRGRRGFKPEIMQDLAYRVHSTILSTGQEAAICSETGSCFPWEQS